MNRQQARNTVDQLVDSLKERNDAFARLFGYERDFDLNTDHALLAYLKATVATMMAEMPEVEKFINYRLQFVRSDTERMVNQK